MHGRCVYAKTMAVQALMDQKLECYLDSLSAIQLQMCRSRPGHLVILTEVDLRILDTDLGT